MKTLAIVLSLLLATPAIVPAAANTVNRLASVEQRTSTSPAPRPLTEEEAEALKQRDETPGKEVAGGSLSNQQLTYIVIALAAAVIVLILVH